MCVHRAIHPEAHIAARLHGSEQLGELAFFLARHWRQHHQARVLGQRQHRVHHLADGLRLQRQLVVWAIGRAGARIQQTQVVVDLGHRADGRARVVAGGLLLDGNGRRQAFDQIDIGLVEAPEKLARIGGQALDIAALAFGIQRVERQARLARTRQSGDHHQLVARNVQVDVLQVVRARTADADAPLGLRLAQHLGQRAAFGAVVRKSHGVARRAKGNRRVHSGRVPGKKNPP